MIAERPKLVTLGLIFIGELIVLACWGYLTPGQIIPLGQSFAVLGGTALVIALISLSLYKTLQRRRARRLNPPTASRRLPVAISFVGTIGLGSLGIGTSLNSLVTIALNGLSFAREVRLVCSLSLIGMAVFSAAYLLYWLGLKEGSLKRRVYLFDLGLKANGTG
jgi:hypothetical protein